MDLFRKTTVKRMLLPAVIMAVLLGSLAAGAAAKKNTSTSEIIIDVKAGKKLTARIGKKNLAKKTYQI